MSRVFLTHNWGTHPAYENHHLVGDINRHLKSARISTWFDEERMEGQVMQAMVDGIDNANVLVVCITKEYIRKVNDKANPNDNCQREFNYAMKNHGNSFVAVVTDPDALDTREWKGVFGMSIGNPLYVNLCPNVTGAAREAALHDLATKIQNIGGVAEPEPSHSPSHANQHNHDEVNEELAAFLKELDLSRPREYAIALTREGFNTSKKLMQLEMEDLASCGITARLDVKLLMGLKKNSTTEKVDFESDLANAKSRKDAHGLVRLFQFISNGTEAAHLLQAIRETANQDTEDESIKLGKAGACEAVVKAINEWPNRDAIFQGFAAIDNLAASNSPLLSKAGACETMVSYLVQWGPNDDEIARKGCNAVYMLGYYDPPSKPKLLKLGVRAALHNAKENIRKEASVKFFSTD